MKHIIKHLLLIFLVFMSMTSSVFPEKLNIVTTTGMIADLAINIAKRKAEVISLMGTGVDPHLYKATHGDLRSLQKADIIFYNGLHLEGKMQDIFAKLAKKKDVFAVSADLNKSKIIETNAAHDPHIWFDVSIWMEAAKKVLDKLKEKDPTNKDFYEDNAKKYLSDLNELHTWVKNEIETIPESSRMLITAHDAFGYFGRAYGMEVRGLQGISTASEFGLNDIKRLKEIIISRNIKAVFIESSVPKKFLESLVAGVQAKGKELSIGGELYSDAMGLKDTPEGTYIGMVKHNVSVIVSALK